MTTSRTIELSVVLPAYNEGPAIRQAIERYSAALPPFCCDYEIIVVNDGSTDDTLAIAQEATSNHLQVRVLNNEKNLGQAGAVLRGFSEARGEVVMHNGADLPFDPSDTATVLKRIRDGADVVVVQRKDRRAYGCVRKLISWSNILLIKALLRSPFTDHNFVQAYRRQVLDSVVVESRGLATVTPELILKAHAAGFRVVTHTADYARRDSGRSSITFRKICRSALDLLGLAVIVHRWRVRCASRQSEATEGRL